MQPHRRGNPLFRALEVEKAAAVAAASCVEMVAVAQGGDIRDQSDANLRIRHSRYLALDGKGTTS